MYIQIHAIHSMLSIRPEHTLEECDRNRQTL